MSNDPLSAKRENADLFSSSLPPFSSREKVTPPDWIDGLLRYKMKDLVGRREKLIDLGVLKITDKKVVDRKVKQLKKGEEKLECGV